MSLWLLGGTPNGGQLLALRSPMYAGAGAWAHPQRTTRLWPPSHLLRDEAGPWPCSSPSPWSDSIATMQVTSLGMHQILTSVGQELRANSTLTSGSKGPSTQRTGGIPANAQSFHEPETQTPTWRSGRHASPTKGQGCSTPAVCQGLWDVRAPA